MAPYKTYVLNYYYYYYYDYYYYYYYYRLLVTGLLFSLGGGHLGSSARRRTVSLDSQTPKTFDSLLAETGVVWRAEVLLVAKRRYSFKLFSTP